MKTRLVHTRAGWHHTDTECGLGCKVWRSTWWEEALDNLKGFLARRIPGNVLHPMDRVVWQYQARRRRKVIRLLVARRLKRYARTWPAKKALRPLSWGIARNA